MRSTLVQGHQASFEVLCNNSSRSSAKIVTKRLTDKEFQSNKSDVKTDMFENKLKRSPKTAQIKDFDNL